MYIIIVIKPNDFHPQMVMLYKDPKGDSVLTTATYIQSSFSQQLKQFNPTTQTLS